MTSILDPADSHIVFTGADVADLTERERDVLELITNGYSNQQISQRLYLSINSVKTYVRPGYRKIGAETRSHAVIWGVRHGLLKDWTHPEAKLKRLTGGRLRAWPSRPARSPPPASTTSSTVNPNRRATHCWCLSHRLNAARDRRLG